MVTQNLNPQFHPSIHQFSLPACSWAPQKRVCGKTSKDMKVDPCWLAIVCNKQIVILPHCHIHIILLLSPGCSWRSQACLLRLCWRWVLLPWPSNCPRSPLQGCRSASCACHLCSPARRSDGSATAPCRTRTPSECDHQLRARLITITHSGTLTDWLQTLEKNRRKRKEFALMG